MTTAMPNQVLDKRLLQGTSGKVSLLFKGQLVDAFLLSGSRYREELAELHPRKKAYPMSSPSLTYIRTVQQAEQLIKWWIDVSHHHGVTFSEIGDIIADACEDPPVNRTGTFTIAAAHLYVITGNKRLLDYSRIDVNQHMYVPYVFDCLMGGRKCVSRIKALELVCPEVLYYGITDFGIWEATQGFGAGLSSDFREDFLVYRTKSYIFIVSYSRRGMSIVRALLELLRQVARLEFDWETTKLDPQAVRFTITGIR